MMGERTSFLIIGVSGTTNSGKTTLVGKLKQLFPDAESMCLDHYFLEPDDKRLEKYIVPEVNHVNWEQFGALDMDRMVKDVEKWKVSCSSPSSSQPVPPSVPILIIEGFLIFNHRELTNSFHKKYFLTIDKDTCLERRQHRHYNPPDKPGYFEKVVWPMYLINKQEMETQKDIVYFDGTDNQDKVVQQMASDIHQLITSCSSPDSVAPAH